MHNKDESLIWKSWEIKPARDNIAFEEVVKLWAVGTWIVIGSADGMKRKADDERSQNEHWIWRTK